MKRIVEVLKSWYEKPLIRNAVDAFIMQFMSQFLTPRGYKIVPAGKQEPESVTEETNDSDS